AALCLLNLCVERNQSLLMRCDSARAAQTSTKEVQTGRAAPDATARCCFSEMMSMMSAEVKPELASEG
ncbi:hypothetical protein OFN50_39275, partial [Escherichia coli]|nr:hypothetical protein [Escherichia coli]